MPNVQKKLFVSMDGISIGSANTRLGSWICPSPPFLPKRILILSNHILNWCRSAMSMGGSISIGCKLLQTMSISFEANIEYFSVGLRDLGEMGKARIEMLLWMEFADVSLCKYSSNCSTLQSADRHVLTIMQADLSHAHLCNIKVIYHIMSPVKTQDGMTMM
jgi:hypothetical protein